MKALVPFLAILLLLTPAYATDQGLPLPPPLTVKLNPYVCLAPCTMRATVHVERHPDNQRLALMLEGEDFERRSELDMQHAPKTFEVWYYGIPPGHYKYTVWLVRHEYVVWEEVRNLLVSGG